MDRRTFLKDAVKISALAGLARIGSLDLAAQGRVITLAATGDCLITRRLSIYDDERFISLIKLLREADAAFGNLEMTLPERGAHPAPTGPCGDLNLMADSFIADELKWAGFTAMSLANNHALDYGIEGMYTTARQLERVGIAHAGTGRNLAEARAPGYFDSRSGRIALVACASTFRPWSLAAEGHGEIPGRPGLNPLRIRATYRIAAEQIEVLKKIQSSLIPRPPERIIPEREEAGTYTFFGSRFAAGMPPDVLTEADESDVREITDAVRRAARNADLVLVSIHAHESERGDREVPAKFLQPFARACIDAGADAFIGHGPHLLRGIEIYRNRPIFYSLGNFIFQAEAMKQIPREIYRNCGIDTADPSDFFDRAMKYFEDSVFWESVAALAKFEDRGLAELKLYPVTLRPELPRAQRGRPELADAETGRKIIERMARLSHSYGTSIEYRDGVGLVRL